MIVKKFILLTLFSTLVSAHPSEDFGEASAKYIGLCHALTYLKENYCPLVKAPALERCIDNVVILVPPKFQSNYRLLVNGYKNQIDMNIKASVPGGFAKTMGMFSNDREKACISYGTGTITMMHQLLEESKRIGKSWKEYPQ
jgi:hypothetical protein